MAYDSSQLCKVFDGNGFSFYTYETLDAAATVDSAQYFNDSVDQLRVGDIIMRRTWATAIRSGTISTWGFHIVLSNDGTDVDVSDALAGVVTDTD